ncbi:hypothetical protein [Vibrio fortis]|nr:hypothetical protein [Vibrio fortis]
MKLSMFDAFYDIGLSPKVLQVCMTLDSRSVESLLLLIEKDFYRARVFR